MNALRTISEPVTIVRQTPTGEVRIEAKGSVQSKKAFFLINVDLEEGDLIEQRLATGKIKIYRAVEVTHYNQPRHMAHIEASIEPVATKGAVAARRVDIAGMHPAISAASGTLFADQHYSRAVFAAFQAVEHRIQQATGLEESGVKLMMQTFGANPKIDVARHSGRNAADEREGFRFLFAGAMQAIRNPRGHGVDLPDTAEEALEYLALASLFMRRLDQAGA
ncbi:TIGR02391 family protein [Micromonospora chersina]|uniref:TIGR02391 family protein n=1 Tax=Micromonospora chersina TaxID=47854 RepID=UPI00340348EB